jgi:exopolysaccharide biosynthesis polyprenyl glycosylphosphotransferase
MLLADLAVLHCCVLAAAAARLAVAGAFPIAIPREMLFQVLAAVSAIPVGFAIAGLYPAYGTTPVERLRLRALIVAGGFALLVAFDYLAQNGQWSRGLLLGASVLALVASPLGAAIARAALSRLPAWGDPAILCGPPGRRAAFAAALARDRDLGWRPVAACDEPARAAGLGVRADLIVVLLEPGGDVTLAGTEDLPFARIVAVPDLAAHQSLWVSVRDIGGAMALESRRNLLLARNRALKRCVDLACVAVLAPVALAAAAAGAIAIRLFSRGPVFYRQMREGRDGRPFGMWKLRTMRADAEVELDRVLSDSPAARAEWSRHMKLRGDPRIVPVAGRFLRRFSVDELPQLWNVFTGQMSLVGPRPLPFYHAERLRPEARALRRRVTPGITGLWQVAGRSEGDVEKLEYLDAYYVRNWSIWLDIHVLATTVRTVLLGRGAW